MNQGLQGAGPVIAFLIFLVILTIAGCGELVNVEVDPGVYVELPTFTPYPSATPSPSPTVDEFAVEADIAYQPIFRCPTPTPISTACPLEICNTPEPTATPYILIQDFPVGRKVQVGPIGQDGLGLWVVVDDVSIENTFTRKDVTGDGVADNLSIAVWSVTATNAGSTERFDFVPPFTSSIYEVQQLNGTTIVGDWFLDTDAMEELVGNIFGIPLLIPSFYNNNLNDWVYFLEFTDEYLEDLDDDEVAEFSYDRYILEPGETTRFFLATYIPQGIPTRIGYIFRPSDAGSEFPGGNVATWRTQLNADDLACPNASLYVPPEGLDGDPIEDTGDVLLSRWPVDGGTISRGYGCSAVYTGELGSGCPTSEPWYHNGIDIAVATGANYYDVLPNGGSVTYSGAHTSGADCSEQFPDADAPQTGYGIMVQHAGLVEGEAVSIIAGHLSGVSVSSFGSTVSGQRLGLTGNTGCSSASHLHFGVAIDGVFVDPESVLP